MKLFLWIWIAYICFFQTKQGFGFFTNPMITADCDSISHPRVMWNIVANLPMKNKNKMYAKTSELNINYYLLGRLKSSNVLGLCLCGCRKLQILYRLLCSQLRKYPASWLRWHHTHVHHLWCHDLNATTNSLTYLLFIIVTTQNAAPTFLQFYVYYTDLHHFEQTARSRLF